MRKDSVRSDSAHLQHVLVSGESVLIAVQGNDNVGQCGDLGADNLPLN